jgi:Tfp pilus assembly protein PilO
MPAGLLVTAICIVLFVLLPAIGRTVEQFEDVNILRDQVDILQQKVNVLNNLDESNLEQNVALATSAISVDKSLPTILTTMEGLSERAGVTLLSLEMDSPGSLASQAANRQFSAEEKKIGAFSVPFSVTLSGTFDQIKTFLATSNKVRRLVRARSFTINFNEEELKTQISFETFYAPLSVRNEIEKLQLLKNKDFETLATLEQYPNVGALPMFTPVTSSPQGEARPDPFSL